VIRDDGTIVRQNGVSSVSHTGTGRYTVGFTSTIASCAWLATAAQIDTGTVDSIEITVNKDTDTTIRVATTDDGTDANEDFVVAAVC
jgi:hypothetical protein